MTDRAGTAFDTVFGPRTADLDRTAFFVALVLTPVCFGVSGIVFFFYGVFVTLGAVVMGAPVYLTLGAFAIYVAVTRGTGKDGLPSYGACCLSALVAVLAGWPFAVAVLVLDGQTLAAAIASATQYVLLGTIAGPLQGVLFAAIYRSIAVPAPIVDADTFT